MKVFSFKMFENLGCMVKIKPKLFIAIESETRKTQKKCF